MLLRALSLRRGASLALRQRPQLSRALATASSDANPLLECVRARALPPFAVLETSHIVPAVQAAAADFARDLRALEQRVDTANTQQAPLRWREVAEPLELQSDPLARLWGVVGHLLSVRNSPDLRAAHDALQPLVVATFTEAAQSRALFDAFQQVRASAEWNELSLAQQVTRSAMMQGAGPDLT